MDNSLARSSLKAGMGKKIGSVRGCWQECRRWGGPGVFLGRVLKIGPCARIRPVSNPSPRPSIARARLGAPAPLAGRLPALLSPRFSPRPALAPVFCTGAAQPRPAPLVLAHFPAGRGRALLVCIWIQNFAYQTGRRSAAPVNTAKSAINSGIVCG